MGFLGDLISDVTEPIGGLFKDVGSGVSSVITPIGNTINGLGNTAGNVLGKGLDVGQNFLEAPLKLFSNPFVIIGLGVVAIVVLPPLLKR